MCPFTCDVELDKPTYMGLLGWQLTASMMMLSCWASKQKSQVSMCLHIAPSLLTFPNHVSNLICIFLKLATLNRGKPRNPTETDIS